MLIKLGKLSAAGATGPAGRARDGFDPGYAMGLAWILSNRRFHQVSLIRMKRLRWIAGLCPVAATRALPLKMPIGGVIWIFPDFVKNLILSVGDPRAVYSANTVCLHGIATSIKVYRDRLFAFRNILYFPANLRGFAFRVSRTRIRPAHRRIRLAYKRDFLIYSRSHPV